MPDYPGLGRVYSGDYWLHYSKKYLQGRDKDKKIKSKIYCRTMGEAEERKQEMEHYTKETPGTDIITGDSYYFYDLWIEESLYN